MEVRQVNFLPYCLKEKLAAPKLDSHPENKCLGHFPLSGQFSGGVWECLKPLYPPLGGVHASIGVSQGEFSSL